MGSLFKTLNLCGNGARESCRGLFARASRKRGQTPAFANILADLPREFQGWCLLKPVFGTAGGELQRSCPLCGVRGGKNRGFQPGGARL